MTSAVLVAGTGLMGPAAAFCTMGAADVHAVDLADVSQVQLDAAWRARLDRRRDQPELRAGPFRSRT